MEHRNRTRKHGQERLMQHLLTPEEQDHEARYESSGTIRTYLRFADQGFANASENSDEESA